MTKDELFEIYKANYFHEMEVRERMTTRIQLNFALVVAIYSIASYMVRMVDFEQSISVVVVFYMLITTVFITSTGCLYNLLKAYWGNEYKGVPSAIETDKYRKELLDYRSNILKYNFQYPNNAQPTINVDKTLKLYLHGKYKDCSSTNTEVNDLRSAHIHQSFKWLLFLSIPFILAGAVFIFGNLDVSSPRKETPIRDKAVSEGLHSISTALKEIGDAVKSDQALHSEVNKVGVSISSEISKLEEILSKIELAIKTEKEVIIMTTNNKPAPPPPVTPSQPPARKVIENKEPKPKM